MVKHQGAKHDVEPPIRKRQVLGNGNLKRGTRTRLSRFAIRSRNHGGRRVDARDRACRPYVPGRGDRQRPGSAADVEDVVACLQAGKADDGLSQLALSAVRQQPRQQVVASGPVEDQTMSAWGVLLIHRSLHSQRRLEMRLAPKNMFGLASVTGHLHAFVRFLSEQEEPLAGSHVTDARVRRTQRRLRDAIVSLIHEKSYPAIAVNEILERADVGRSAFYAHFPNKDALLASGIEQMLHATAPRTLPPSVGRFGNALRFSFPVFEYIGHCRHAAEAKMGRRGRAIVHQHLRRVLAEHIRDEVRQALEAGRWTRPRFR